MVFWRSFVSAEFEEIHFEVGLPILSLDGLSLICWLLRYGQIVRLRPLGDNVWSMHLLNIRKASIANLEAASSRESTASRSYLNIDTRQH